MKIRDAIWLLFVMQMYPRYFQLFSHFVCVKDKNLWFFFWKILLDDNKRAYGVAYTRHGFPQIATARKEIILSAGAYSSPLLLMKSGIGPESILNAAEVNVDVNVVDFKE